jgi:hypothetical protein
MRFCCAIKELVRDANLFKGDSRMPHPVRGFSRDDLFDGIPTQGGFIQAAGLALNQDARRAVDGNYIDTVIVFRGRHGVGISGRIHDSSCEHGAGDAVRHSARTFIGLPLEY